MLRGIYVVVFNFVQTSTKTFCNLPLSWNVAFLLHRTSFLQKSMGFFHIAVNLGKRCFVTVVAGVITLCVVPRIELTKLNNYIIPFFLICQRESYEKKYRLWEPWMTFLLLHLNNSIVCFYYHLHFLWWLQRSQAQQQKFCTREKPNFSLNKKMHIVRSISNARVRTNLTT